MATQGRSKGGGSASRKERSSVLEDLRRMLAELIGPGPGSAVTATAVRGTVGM